MPVYLPVLRGSIERMDKQKVAEAWCARLNNLLTLEGMPVVLDSLMGYRIPVSDEVADSPYVTVTDEKQPKLGALGLINGLLHPYQLIMVIEDGRIVSFQVGTGGDVA